MSQDHADPVVSKIMQKVKLDNEPLLDDKAGTSGAADSGKSQKRVEIQIKADIIDRPRDKRVEELRRRSGSKSSEGGTEYSDTGRSI